ncbi:MAG: pantoate--beta-alanine ligase [Selenomonadaceae bacterium]|nr:pantoate--beta-alanine ligase [Selenomonadaceae bacterium]
MKILRTVKEIQAYAKEMKAAGKKIGLVPTMGALHEGHLTLMRKARETCDIVIASVFVNPVQFGPNEDYEAYPRRFEADCEKLESVSVDAVFHPEPEEMYPEGFSTYVTVEGEITDKLCGAQRPGHFRGVATVVTKLINLARADEAFFGQKDAQQVVVIRRFVEDLNLNVHIHMVPIVREESGLARSSRNQYLSAEEKEAALVLSRSLKRAEEAYAHGERNVEKLKSVVKNTLNDEPLAAVDYVDLYSFPGLTPMYMVAEPALLAIAVKIGKTRLIDNTILGKERA